MTRYSKGARSERELMAFLHERSYSVIRSAGSGVNPMSPPDIIAIKQGKGMAFECKAWDKGSLSIEPDKIAALEKWEANTGMTAFVAWRMNGTGWFFIRLSEMKRNPKNFSVTRSIATAINRRFEAIVF
ncbi:MAG TPA: Holliday junction resolvase Hjc [Candidatus Acidoferrales bacterium]|nr:Holliday junction resolvase Hjc [Candidatus Acidoferrales bacterium]